MAGRKYDQAYDGEWFEVTRRDFHLACCDCGLVHSLDFRIRKGQLQMRAWRRNRETSAIRRGKKSPFPCVLSAKPNPPLQRGRPKLKGV